MRWVLWCLLVVQLALGQPPQAFLQKFNALYGLMVKNYEEGLINGLGGVRFICDNPNRYQNSMRRHAIATFALALDMMNQVPLFQTFKPRTPQEAHLLRTIKVYEAMQVLLVLSENIPDSDCAEILDVPSFDTTTSAQSFLNSWDFVYAPLFKKHQEGVDILKILENLPKSQPNDIEGSPDDDMSFDSDGQKAYRAFSQKFLGVDFNQKPAILLDAYYESLDAKPPNKRP
ncbi:hypothetical protein [Helicobacter salomonis]|uniref:hypothetical protein n=1 Tax=Helicobacter salomonis TaxID=56878 RepID=UPI000CF02256|nr:hypothetical protein [Helicobacter salomonis]